MKQIIIKKDNEVVILLDKEDIQEMVDEKADTSDVNQLLQLVNNIEETPILITYNDDSTESVTLLTKSDTSN